MEKRKNVTFSRDIFNALKRLKDPERLEIYDSLFSHFFDGKTIDYEKIKSDVVQAVLSCLTPEMRKIQIKYDNGSCEKLNKNSSLFNCENNGSETKRTEANASERDCSDYLIQTIYEYIYNNQSINLNNIYINNIIYNNRQIMQKCLKSLKSDKQATLENVMTKVMTSKENQVKIAGEPKNAAEVLDTICALLLEPSKTEEMNQKINEIKNLKSLHNPLSYLTVALYNLARSQSQPKNSSNSATRANSEIISHNYSREELQKVFDDLDTDEI